MKKRTAIATRLERVREWAGVPDLKSFWRALAGNDPENFLSYEAVRTYHGSPYYDPPSSYLARILVRYPFIDGQWLLTGVGTGRRDVTADTATEHLLRVRKAWEEAIGFDYSLEDDTRSLDSLYWTINTLVFTYALDDAADRALTQADIQEGEIMLSRRLGQALRETLQTMKVNSLQPGELAGLLPLWSLAIEQLNGPLARERNWDIARLEFRKPRKQSSRRRKSSTSKRES